MVNMKNYNYTSSKLPGRLSVQLKEGKVRSTLVICDSYTFESAIT